MRFVEWLCVLAILGLPESARAQSCDRKSNETVATAYKMKVPWRAARKKAAPHREVARIHVGEDFVVCDGDVDFIRVDPPRKELWGGSFIVMWDPADGKLEVSGVDAYGRSVGVVTFADDRAGWHSMRARRCGSRRPRRFRIACASKGNASFVATAARTA
jgi:hypothetical protein